MKPTNHTNIRNRGFDIRRPFRQPRAPTIDYAYQDSSPLGGGCYCFPRCEKPFREIGKQYLEREAARSLIAEGSVFAVFLVSAFFSLAHCGAALLRMLEGITLR